MKSKLIKISLVIVMVYMVRSESLDPLQCDRVYEDCCDPIENSLTCEKCEYRESCCSLNSTGHCLTCCNVTSCGTGTVCCEFSVEFECLQCCQNDSLRISFWGAFGVLFPVAIILILCLCCCCPASSFCFRRPKGRNENTLAGAHSNRVNEMVRVQPERSLPPASAAPPPPYDNFEPPSYYSATQPAN